MKYKEFYTVLPVKDNAPHIIQGVVKGDTANIVNCTLMMGDDPFDFTGYTDIILSILKPDETKILSVVTSEQQIHEDYDPSNEENPYMIRAIKPEDGTLSFVLQGQATIITGTYFAQITLLREGVLMSSVRINYSVQENIDIGLDDPEVSQTEVTGLRNLINLAGAVQAAEQDRSAADAIRRGVDKERERAEAVRDAKTAAMERMVKGYLLIADEYVAQTEANKEAARAYAMLAAEPSEQILSTILENMDVPNKEYVDTRDRYYHGTIVDGSKRQIKIKRTDEDGVQEWETVDARGTRTPEGDTLNLYVQDSDKFTEYFSQCVATLDPDEDRINGNGYAISISYIYSDEIWQLVLGFAAAYSKSFPIAADFDDIGLRVSGSPAEVFEENSLHSFRLRTTGKTYRIISDPDNQGTAVFEIIDQELFNDKFGFFITTPQLFDRTIKLAFLGNGQYDINCCYEKYSAGGTASPGCIVRHIEDSENLAAVGLLMTGSKWSGDKFYITVANSGISTERGELSIDENDDVYIGLGGDPASSLQLTKLYHAGTQPPADKRLLWVDTGNSVMKYWSGTQWTIINQAVFS